MTDLGLGLDFLRAQSWIGIVQFFWFTLIFDIPRYLLAIGILGGALRLAERGRVRARTPTHHAPPRVTVVVAGHNEAPSLRRCLESLREQSWQPLEVVVVSDGSTDGMAREATRCVQDGLASRALATELRAGKSAAVNLAIGAATGELIVVVDCDCSYDRFAIERIIRPLVDDPRMGAVSGDVIPRNATASLVASFQDLEYLVSISIGRRVAAVLGMVTCVSGAFGGFRRSALDEIGGMDVGGGEDLDVTLRLRGAGWRVTFVSDAVCYTDVPVRLWNLVRQRLRWDRDAMRLRYRKHRRLFAGSPREMLHQWESLVFDLLATAVFPLYLVWLFGVYGRDAVPLLLATQLAMMLLDLVVLCMAGLIAPHRVSLSHLLFVPGYSVFNGWVMRSVRLLAYIQEWLLFGSVRDNYVPAKVREIRQW
jgi:cellulose synthase/poly-beta-1,6-N-acetylglucosamine synthase-like glycosyltransferase